MSSLNKAIILGRLGKDIELRNTQGGKSVANMAVATDHSYNDQAGQTHKATEWHNIVLWGKTAENCAKFLGKGSQVLVEGRLQTSKYKDKDGGERYKTEIIADNVQFIGTKKEGEVVSQKPTAARLKEDSVSPAPTYGGMSDMDILNSIPF